MSLKDLSPEELFIYKWQFRILGSFKTALATLISLADGENTRKLAKGFPVEVEGYRLFSCEDGWWKTVKVKASLPEQSNKIVCKKCEEGFTKENSCFYQCKNCGNTYCEKCATIDGKFHPACVGCGSQDVIDLDEPGVLESMRDYEDN